ncbi:MAG: serine/threonine protein kinase [Myxococcales bacterium]|nr:serine/threonine protein kinase [Myxococcales bacterium]
MGERRTLGRFVCGERVASGPIGALHRARVYGDAGFEKDFALLVVDGKLSRDRGSLGRLVRAANGWARLNYPRIAHAHELGVEDDTYYLVSDWLRAATVGALTVDGPLPVDIALLLAADIADAVAHAHARQDLVAGGILHLGLCPETVLIDAAGNVTVRDFGLLAARITPNWADDDRLVYVLRYCAPEVQEGGIVDVRADVFALGALLFELLTGHPAFGGTRARDIAAQVQASPPSLTGVPAAVGPLLARALEARAAARLPSLTELRTQALALLGDRALAARAALVERIKPRLPADVARPSPLDVAAEAEPAGAAIGVSSAVRAITIADDYFNAPLSSAAADPLPLPPPPSMIPSTLSDGARPMWGGRPLLQPSQLTVWDPPSTTATTTLDALRRKRSKGWLRAAVPLALLFAVGGAALVWQRVEHNRDRMRAAERTTAEAHRAPPTPPPTRVASTPPGAQIYVDGVAFGQTPVSLALENGEHKIVLVAEGMSLWRGPVDAGASIDAQLVPAHLPATLEGEAGLKLVCKQPGLFRVFVDGVDTGRTCPVEERIAMTPGAHKLALYAPRGDRNVDVQRPVVVKDRGSSTRIILEDE